MSDEAAFLDALKANPADDTVRLVYADWCDEYGEPAKAQYLRAVADLARLRGGTSEHTDAVVRLYTACAGTDAGWRGEVGKRFDVMLDKYTDKVQVIIRIRAQTGLGLAEAKALAESVPVAMLSWLPFEVALPHLLAFAHPNHGYVRARVRPTPWLEGAPGSVFDVLLCALQPDHWRSFAIEFAARALNVSTDEATARLRDLPVTVASGLRPADVTGFVRQLKLACNVGSALPPGAVRVVPRLPTA